MGSPACARVRYTACEPMSGALQRHDDDAPPRCSCCGKPAAGPCASCRAMVCGDCCTLTEGSAGTWAICLDCDRRGGRSLAPAWRGLLVWLGLLLIGLFALVVVLERLASGRR